MSLYIYELDGWPEFYWNREALANKLADVRHRQGRLIGRMEAMGFPLRQEAVLQTLTLDVLETSEIEGEILNREQVRSSIARRLGIDIGSAADIDRHIEGVVEMTLDATRNFNAPITAERLFGWHASLFPTGYSGISRIRVGSWRDDAHGKMQVVSGPMGRERIHFEAPAAPLVDREMTIFLEWFNGDNSIDPVLKSALAHLWFVTIHPFDDGNGRIARAIADLALARSEQTAQRFYSMSAQIYAERKTYYNNLEVTQKATLDITYWMEWFLDCLGRAFDGTQKSLASVLGKARFWETHASLAINVRQRIMLGKLLDGFDGKLTSSKWAKISKCSQDTALRDITELVDLGVLSKALSGGRCTSYYLANPTLLVDADV